MDSTLIIHKLTGGGAERVLAETYNHFPDDYEATLVLINDDGCVYDLEKPFISLGLNRGKPTNILYYTSIIPKSIWKYSRILNKYKPKTSLSLNTLDNLVNIISCKLTGVKPVVQIRADWTNDKIKRSLLVSISEYVNLLLMRVFCLDIIVNSENVKSNLRSKCNLSKNKITVIYNPKDIENINEDKVVPVSHPFFDTECPLLITSGRLAHEKGHWHLLRIFSTLKKTHDCKLVICGDGPLRTRLEQLATELNIQDDVLFLGWCTNPYMYINRANLFVYSSLIDGLPNAVIEALIVGCPIVSTDCDCGPREILQDGKSGLLTLPVGMESFNAYDPLTTAEKDMLDKIILLLDNPDYAKELAANGLQSLDRFKFENSVYKYIQALSTED